MELTVECQKRPEGSQPNALRRGGMIPANLYGHKGTEAISLVMNAKTAETMLKKASVNNTIIDLNITDGKTLVREVQSHPYKGNIYHISFFAVAAQDSVDVEVPLHFVGDAVGVKQESGIVDTLATSLQIRCNPDSIPEAIEINISNLHVGDSLYVRELVLPSGVTVLGDTEQAVVTVLSPQKTTAAAVEELEAEAGTESASESDAEAE
jgi:large subunit ribosomal protein L25